MTHLVSLSTSPLGYDTPMTPQHPYNTSVTPL